MAPCPCWAHLLLLPASAAGSKGGPPGPPGQWSCMDAKMHSHNNLAAAFHMYGFRDAHLQRSMPSFVFGTVYQCRISLLAGLGIGQQTDPCNISAQLTCSPSWRCYCKVAKFTNQLCPATPDMNAGKVHGAAAKRYPQQPGARLQRVVAGKFRDTESLCWACCRCDWSVVVCLPPLSPRFPSRSMDAMLGQCSQRQVCIGL